MTPLNRTREPTPSGGKSCLVITRVEILAAGWGRHLEFFLHGNGSWNRIDTPALFALIHHKTHGRILYDTGYAHHFFEATRPFPERLMRYLTPVERLRSAAEQLEARGLKADHLIVGHLHPDHIAGLRDFPGIPFHAPISQRPGRSWNRWQGLKHVLLQHLWSPTFDEQVQWLEPDTEFPPFGKATTVLDDFIGVDLPGHALGQMGLYFQCGRRKVLLAADAVFTSRALREGLWPSRLMGAVTHDWEQMKSTARRLRKFQEENPEILIIPSHCGEMAGLVIEG